MNDEVRALVLQRDGGTCQRCGKHVGSTVFGGNHHHRKRKGMGGSKFYDTVQNIVTLCGTGSTQCHGEVHANRDGDMYDLGWLVRRSGGTDPAAVPVQTYWGPMVYTDDGRAFRTSDPGEAPHG